MTNRGFWAALFAQLRSPLIRLLCGAALVAGLVREWTDTIVICAIVVLSTLVALVQDRPASKAVAGLACQAVGFAGTKRGCRLGAVERQGDGILLTSYATLESAA